MKAVADNAITAATLAGSGADTGLASGIIALASTAAGSNSNKGSVKSTSTKVGTRALLLAESAASQESATSSSQEPGELTALNKVVLQVAGLLQHSLTTATGHVSAGDEGVFVTVAKLRGDTAAEQVVAVGSSFVAPQGLDPAAVGSSQAASAAVATNVQMRFAGGLKGACASADADAQTENNLGETADTAICADGVVGLHLYYYESASLFLYQQSSTFNTSAGSNGSESTGGSAKRRLLNAMAVSPAELELLSGVVQVKMGDQGALPCAVEGGCNAILTIPLTGAVGAGDPQVQCLQLEQGAAYYSPLAAGQQEVPALATASVELSKTDPTVPVVTCRFSTTGTYAAGRVLSIPARSTSTVSSGPIPSPSSSTVTSTTSSVGTLQSSSATTSPSSSSSNLGAGTSTVLNTPAPSSSIGDATTGSISSSSSSPSVPTFSGSGFQQPAQGTPEGTSVPGTAIPLSPSAAASPAQAPAKQELRTTLAISFSLDYAAFIADTARVEAFKAALTNACATAAGVPATWVAVKNLRPGSVVADVELTVPATASLSSSQVKELTQPLVTSPDAAFARLKADFGIQGPVITTVIATAEPTEFLSSGAAALARAVAVAREASRRVGLGVGLSIGGAVALVLLVLLVLVVYRRGRQVVHVRPTIQTSQDVTRADDSVTDLAASGPRLGSPHGQGQIHSASARAQPALSEDLR
jgi:hypothetical protein